MLIGIRSGPQKGRGDGEGRGRSPRSYTADKSTLSNKQLCITCIEIVSQRKSYSKHTKWFRFYETRYRRTEFHPILRETSEVTGYVHLTFYEAPDRGLLLVILNSNKMCLLIQIVTSSVCLWLKD